MTPSNHSTQSFLNRIEKSLIHNRKYLFSTAVNLTILFIISIVLQQLGTFEVQRFINLGLFLSTVIVFNVIALIIHQKTTKNTIIGNVEIIEDTQEEWKNEMNWEREFSKNHPKIYRIFWIRGIVKWIHYEGWRYCMGLISLFAIIFILRLLFYNWSGGYDNFHSGETMFLKLINSFSDGNFGASSLKSQSIMVYLFGMIAIFLKEMGIYSLNSLRICMNIISFINIFLVYNISRYLFRNEKDKKLIAFIATYLFGFSYFIIFYSNIVRPDSILLLLFNLFFYYILSEKQPNFILIGIIAGLSFAFKGSGLLLIGGSIVLYLLTISKSHNFNIKKLINLKYILTLSVLCATAIGVYLLTTPFANMDLIKVFFHIKGSLYHFSTGHYGLFPSNITTYDLLIEKISLLVWAFSPLILFTVIGLPIYLKNNLRFKRDISYETLKKLFLTVFALVFFIYIFSKPIQFGRYYFPCIGLFFIFSSYGIVKLIKNRMIIISLLILFLIFNTSFYFHMLNNTRIEAYNNISHLDDIFFVPFGTKGWTYPPLKIAMVENVTNMPKNSYLLVSGQYYYQFARYIENPDSYRDTDWHPYSSPPYKQIQLFEEIISKEPKYVIKRKNLFLFDNQQVPFDIWYMTHPDYYVYSSDVFLDLDIKK